MHKIKFRSSFIKKLLKKIVIKVSRPEVNEFILGVFARAKNSNKRTILNLKKFNIFVNYEHFKMESINNVINQI